jgi:hypothetical protein
MTNKVMGFEDVFTAIVSGKGEMYLVQAQQDFETVCNERVVSREKMTMAIIEFEVKKAQFISDSCVNKDFKTTLKNELAIAKYPAEWREMMILIDKKKAHDIFIRKLENRIMTIKMILNTKKIF